VPATNQLETERNEKEGHGNRKGIDEMIAKMLDRREGKTILQ